MLIRKQVLRVRTKMSIINSSLSGSHKKLNMGVLINLTLILPVVRASITHNVGRNLHMNKKLILLPHGILLSKFHLI